MKCPKCGWMREGIVLPCICPWCGKFLPDLGTGEVSSRSIQRREALQKGEPMPEFDKPEMPSESYYKVIEGSFTPLKMFIWQSGLDGDVPLYSCSELAHGVKGRWYIPEIYVERNYLPADKVRELVRAFDGAKCLTEEKAKKAEELLHALFPEGLGGEE